MPQALLRRPFVVQQIKKSFEPRKHVEEEGKKVWRPDFVRLVAIVWGEIPSGPQSFGVSGSSKGPRQGWGRRGSAWGRWGLPERQGGEEKILTRCGTGPLDLYT